MNCSQNKPAVETEGSPFETLKGRMLRTNASAVTSYRIHKVQPKFSERSPFESVKSRMIRTNVPSTVEFHVPNKIYMRAPTSTSWRD